MARSGAMFAALLLTAGASWADVSRLEHQTLKHQMEAAKSGHTRHGGVATRSEAGKPSRTGEQALTDASGLEYFINSNITFATSSSASGAASEASYTQAVNATTSAGGTVASTLNDAFDGYNSICVSTTGASGPCATGDTDYTIYNDNGAGSLDAACDDGNNQVVLNPQTIGSLTLQRKIYVPDNDEFARWANIITNNGGGTATVRLLTSNNLGSDSNTVIVSSSSGDATATTSDTWVSTFQNYSGNTSSDPRLGHVFGDGAGAANVSLVNFADGDDNPFWGYDLSIPAGDTAIILNYVTGQPSKAAANSKAAELASGTNANQFNCLSATELGEVLNFAGAAPAPPGPPGIPTASTLGLAALTVLLAGAAFLVLRRRA